MIIYDARPTRVVLQVLTDLVVIAGIILGVVIGRAISASISGLASIGTRVHEQGTAFQQQLAKTSKALGNVPFIGNDVSKPLKDASNNAGSIAAAGTQQHDQTLHLAHLVGTSTTVVLIAVLLVIWVRYRGRFIRTASATRRLDRRPGGTDVLALRALVNRDAVTKLGFDVVDRWRGGDLNTVLALANLERRSSGLRAHRAL